MVTVKLFGALRLRSGLREYRLDCASLDELFRQLSALSAELGRETVSIKELRGCIVLVNGKESRPRRTLADGDQVVLMTPASGG